MVSLMIGSLLILLLFVSFLDFLKEISLQRVFLCMTFVIFV
jgi:hypothetical protein